MNMPLIKRRTVTLACFFVAACHLTDTVAMAADAIDTDALISQIKSGDAEAQRASVQLLRAKLSTDPEATVSLLQRSLLQPMLQAKMHDEVAELALGAAIASAKSTSTVEALMTFRVRALLAAGRGEEAVAAAKSLFNVSSMAGTSGAVELFAQALGIRHPTQEAIGIQFRAEQVLGMSAATGEPTRTSKVIRDSKVDGTLFLAAIPDTVKEEYNALVGKGNLLLLADKVDQARSTFEVAYMLADNRMLPAATENLARCIKAEDGTIGRANAFVMSLRAPTK